MEKKCGGIRGCKELQGGTQAIRPIEHTSELPHRHKLMKTSKTSFVTWKVVN